MTDRPSPAQRPYVICHMLVSLDGRIHPSRWTASPDGSRSNWSEAYERIHREMGADAWLIGRVTMAEMSKAAAHAPAGPYAPPRPAHLAGKPGPFGIALDPSGKLHFAKPEISGDPVVVLLGPDVPDSHLAELQADGISYLVAAEDPMNVAAMLETLGRELGINRLLLEGGGHTNGQFLRAGLVDEVSLLVAPAIDGGDGVSGVFDAGEALGDVACLSLLGAETLEHGLVHLRYRVDRN